MGGGKGKGTRVPAVQMSRCQMAEQTAAQCSYTDIHCLLGGGATLMLANNSLTIKLTNKKSPKSSCMNQTQKQLLVNIGKPMARQKIIKHCCCDAICTCSTYSSSW